MSVDWMTTMRRRTLGCTLVPKRRGEEERKMVLFFSRIEEQREWEGR
jgi:hypothetical protein